jgi:hypothetical protein
MYPQDQRINHQYSVSPEDAYFQRERFNHVHDATTRLITLLGGTLTTLLSLRFVFALLDANQANSIVAFVNSFTRPFVEPFYSLFTYGHETIGSMSLEGYTLVAIIAYSLLTTGLVRLATITRY